MAGLGSTSQHSRTGGPCDRTTALGVRGAQPGRARSEDLHRLTLEAEIAADIASPVEDQQARMALQVELINKGLNNLTLIDNKQLIERWCASGPKAASANALRARFFSALAQRL